MKSGDFWGDPIDTEHIRMQNSWTELSDDRRVPAVREKKKK
jgi:hypothetical protein